MSDDDEESVQHDRHLTSPWMIRLRDSLLQNKEDDLRRLFDEWTNELERVVQNDVGDDCEAAPFSIVCIPLSSKYELRTDNPDSWLRGEDLQRYRLLQKKSEWVEVSPFVDIVVGLVNVCWDENVDKISSAQLCRYLPNGDCLSISPECIIELNKNTVWISTYDNWGNDEGPSESMINVCLVVRFFGRNNAAISDAGLPSLNWTDTRRDIELRVWTASRNIMDNMSKEEALDLMRRLDVSKFPFPPLAASREFEKFGVRGEWTYQVARIVYNIIRDRDRDRKDCDDDKDYIQELQEEAQKLPVEWQRILVTPPSLYRERFPRLMIQHRGADGLLDIALDGNINQFKEACEVYFAVEGEEQDRTFKRIIELHDKRRYNGVYVCGIILGYASTDARVDMMFSMISINPLTIINAWQLFGQRTCSGALKYIDLYCTRTMKYLDETALSAPEWFLCDDDMREFKAFMMDKDQVMWVGTYSYRRNGNGYSKPPRFLFGDLCTYTIAEPKYTGSEFDEMIRMEKNKEEFIRMFQWQERAQIRELRGIL